MAEARVFSGQCGIDGDLRFAAGRWGVLKNRSTGPQRRHGRVRLSGHRQGCDQTHTVFVASFVAVRLDSSREPLIYLRGRYAQALAAQPRRGIQWRQIHWTASVLIGRRSNSSVTICNVPMHPCRA
jgi:hypothetical protein